VRVVYQPAAVALNMITPRDSLDRPIGPITPPAGFVWPCSGDGWLVVG
jgi:hypothetical protein